MAKTRRRPNGTPYAKLTTKGCTTLLADRNQRLEVVLPECCTQSSIVPNVQPRTQVISPGPVANGLTQCRPPAEAPPATPAAAYACNARRSLLQQKQTPAEDSYPPWKECVCAHGDRVRRQKPRPPKRATRHAQAQAQANRLMTYYGYAGRYP